MIDPPANADRVEAILATYFPAGVPRLEITASLTAVPLVAARLTASTRSFTAGQKVLVHDGYWGMNERVMVVARYRRKHRWIRGVCPIAQLTAGRVVVVHDPAVLALLRGTWVSRDLLRTAGRFAAAET